MGVFSARLSLQGRRRDVVYKSCHRGLAHAWTLHAEWGTGLRGKPITAINSRAVVGFLRWKLYMSQQQHSNMNRAGLKEEVS
jgi:hypothetical protein